MEKIYIFGLCLFTLLASSALAEEGLWGYKIAQKKQEQPHMKRLVLPIKEDVPEKEPEKNPAKNPAKERVESDIIAPDYISMPVPKAALRKGTIITQDHLDFIEMLPQKVSAQFASDPMQIVGQQARRTLYKEKPIRIADTGPVILIKRNQDVDLFFSKNGILIKTHGRALSDGGAGERIKVMNITSKQVVFGKITDSGAVDVSL